MAGLYLYSACGFEMLGPGVEASPKLKRTLGTWFEGPILPLPDSQQPEDYPRDMAGTVRIAADAPTGPRRARLWTAEGAATGLTFVVGDLPEVVEEEVDGDPIPVAVTLPMTINGRIFPREDVDLWTFSAKKGQSVTAEAQAARIGSPLDSRLEVLDAEGRVLAENDDALGTDSRLRFVAPTDGNYTIRVRDAAGRGGLHYVYRLTLTSDPFVESVFPLGGRRGSTAALALTGQGVPARAEVAIPADAPSPFLYRWSGGGKTANAIPLDVDDLPEEQEAEPNDALTQAREVKAPVIANGRIDRPGDIDQWAFVARKGETFALELRAAQLGSPLLGVLAVCDATGKELARAEAAAPGSDPVLSFTAPVDGKYAVRVADRFHGRGGTAFAYRLRIGPPPVADFRLHFDLDALTLKRGVPSKLRVSVDRQGGFAGPIELALDGLPAGVKVTSSTIPAGQPAVEVSLDATAAAPIGPCRITVKGKAMVGKTTKVATATLAPKVAQGVVVDSVLGAVGLAVPFKITGDYDMRIVPRGTIHHRRFKVVRNGFDGPLEVSLADHQMRHLQGVTAPTVTVPAGATELDYAVNLPPWMETGRTSRACVQAVGRIKDGGIEHEVGFSSEGQNEQVIAVVETNLLGMEAGVSSVAAEPGGKATVPIRVRRGKGLSGPVKVELIVPSHVQGVTGEPATIAADAGAGTVTVRFGPAPGPFNVPLVLRASLLTPAGPHITETKVEVVVPK